MVTFAWLGETWEAARCGPVKFTSVDDYTSDCGTMTTDPLGRAVDYGGLISLALITVCLILTDNICAVVNGSNVVPSSTKCIIHNKWEFMLVGNLRTDVRVKYCFS